MGNLLVSLQNAAGAMRIFERGIGVVQGNVTNASTPGFARQRQLLESMRFDLDAGLPGGVRSAGTQDSRDQYAEASVRQRLSGFGLADERAQQLERLEPVFDIRANSGLGGALNELFASFSALSVAPNDLSARRVVLDQAGELARAFQSTAVGLSTAVASVDEGLAHQAREINRIGGQIAELNREFRMDYTAQQDAGLQAQMHNLLDELSELADYTVLRADDGSSTIYLGGQTLLTMGDRQYKISVDTSGASALVLDAEARDITDQLSGGRLTALLEVRNQILPEQRFQLDRLAQSLADGVNSVLAGGVDMNGQQPVKPLFQYDAALGSAVTLNVTDLRPEELAAAAGTAPGGNAVALDAASLADAKSIDGYTFTQFYASLAADAGRLLSAARESQETSGQLTSQARQLRDELQQVNLDEEAIYLIEMQRAYQASARLVQTLNEMTETVINLIR